jgi:hypothetical protein
MGAMVEAARGTGLSVHRVRDIGPDYAITLRAWREAWEREKEVRRAAPRRPGAPLPLPAQGGPPAAQPLPPRRPRAA